VPAPPLYEGMDGWQYRLEHAVIDIVCKNFLQYTEKKKSVVLTVCILEVNFKWFNHNVCRFWSMFRLLSSVMRRCAIRTKLKVC
jgi:hypothetical protein